MEFERRALRPDDVAIKITYAGICHSDLHTARNDWGNSVYPIVPGHEIVGNVTAVGSEVTRHRVGDTVAVGVMVDSCMSLRPVPCGWESLLPRRLTQTYNSPDRHDHTITKGGYTDHIVVRDHFVLKVPAGMDVSPRRAAALRRHHHLLAASPVQCRAGHQDGRRRPRWARTHGREVRRCAWRARDDDYHDAGQGRGRPALGAHDVLISTDPQAMAAAATRFDFILNTVPVATRSTRYLALLGRGGRMVIVGALTPMPGFSGMNLIWYDRAVGGSAIGGIPETQEMLDLAPRKAFIRRSSSSP